jgi:tetratricopeptide (TPR) repeat protein
MQTLSVVPERTVRRAAALLAASAIDLRSGTLACGTDHAQQSHEIACELSDVESQWRALQRLGELAVGHDHDAQALKLFEAAREIARGAGLDAYEAVSEYSLGVAHWLQGDLQGAEELLVESAASFRALGDSQTRIPSLLNIAEMRAADPAARPGLRIVFEETLHPLVESSCHAAVGYVLSNQATIARLRGEPAHARALLDEAAARFAESDDRRGRADVLVRRTYLSLSQGSTDEAREQIAQALALRRDMRDRRGVGMALAALGLVETIAGDHERAEQPLAEARDLFRRAGDRWGLVSSLWRTADLGIARGRLDRAEEALQEARAVVGATDRQGWIAVTVAMLAEVAQLHGDATHAAELSEQARELYLAGGDQAGAAAMQARTQSRAKDRQRARKVAAGTTARKAKTKRRQS